MNHNSAFKEGGFSPSPDFSDSPESATPSNEVGLNIKARKISRRDFIKIVGGAVFAAVAAACTPPLVSQETSPIPTILPTAGLLPTAVLPLPAERKVTVTTEQKAYGQNLISPEEAQVNGNFTSAKIQEVADIEDPVTREQLQNLIPGIKAKISELKDPIIYADTSNTSLQVITVTTDKKQQLYYPLAVVDSGSSPNSLVALVKTDGQTVELKRLTAQECKVNGSTVNCLSLTDASGAVILNVNTNKAGYLETPEANKGGLIFQFSPYGDAKKDKSVKLDNISKVFNLMSIDKPKLDPNLGPPEFDQSKIFDENTAISENDKALARESELVMLERVYRFQKGTLTRAEETALSGNREKILDGLGLQSIFSFNGSGDNYRYTTLIIDRSRQIMYWSGTEQGALNDRPNLQGKIFTVSIPDSYKPVIQWNELVPYVIGLKDLKPVNYFEPRLPAQEGNAYTGEWKAVLDITKPQKFEIGKEQGLNIPMTIEIDPKLQVEDPYFKRRLTTIGFNPDIDQIEGANASQKRNDQIYLYIMKEAKAVQTKKPISDEECLKALKKAQETNNAEDIKAISVEVDAYEEGKPDQPTKILTFNPLKGIHYQLTYGYSNKDQKGYFMDKKINGNGLTAFVLNKDGSLTVIVNGYDILDRSTVLNYIEITSAGVTYALIINGLYPILSQAYTGFKKDILINEERDRISRMALYFWVKDGQNTRLSIGKTGLSGIFRDINSLDRININ